MKKKKLWNTPQVEMPNNKEIEENLFRTWLHNIHYAILQHCRNCLTFYEYSLTWSQCMQLRHNAHRINKIINCSEYALKQITIKKPWQLTTVKICNARPASSQLCNLQRTLGTKLCNQNRKNFRGVTFESLHHTATTIVTDRRMIGNTVYSLMLNLNTWSEATLGTFI